MKKIVVVIFLIFLITGCVLNQNDGKSRLYLDDTYYNKGNYIKVSSDKVNDLSGNYVLFTYNSYCNFSVPCDEIFKSFMEKYDIDFLSISIDDFKNTYLYDTVKYAPSIIVISDKKIIAYLDANSDEDLERYTNTKSFEKWMDNYVYFKK